MTPNVPLIAWNPDGDPTVPGVMLTAQQLLPTQRGYAADNTLDTPAAYYGTLPARCYGAETLRFSNGFSLPMAATDTDLYRLPGAGTVDSMSRVAPYTPIAATMNAWRFAAFRTTALAVSYDNTLQACTNPSAGVFSDVSGAPSGGTIAVNRNFVVMARFPGAEDEWKCSALEDYTDWTTDVATQSADGQLTATPGEIIRLIAYNDYIIAFKAASMYRGTYVGATDNTWAWPVVSTEVGLVGHNAVCQADGLLYWMGRDGFYRYGGGAIQRIASAPWYWLRGQMDGLTYIGDTQAHWDPVRRVVRFYFRQDSTDSLTLGIAYHPDSDRWGTFGTGAEWVLTVPFDFVPTPTNSNLDRFYNVPAVFRASLHDLLIYNGTPAGSSFTTGDIGSDDDVAALTKVRLRFLDAPTTSEVTHSYRANLGDALTTGVTASISDGKFDISQAARWHRLEFNQTGMYELGGFLVELPKAGKR